MTRRLQEAWLLIMADRKRATMLGALVVVLLGVSVRELGRIGPGKARAQSRSALLQAAEAETEGSGKTAKSEETSEKQRAATITIERAPPVSRDLFALSELAFPPAQTELTEMSPSEAAKSEPQMDDTHPVARADDAELVRERVTREAGVLRLRSAVVGATPTAVIGFAEGARGGASAVVGLGQLIRGFKVIEIGPAEVLVEKEGVRVTLKRALPER